MALKPCWKPRDIKTKGDLIRAALDQKVFEVLAYTGEQFVATARQLANFTDKTGNLRSSIGYIIIKDGKIVKGDFQKSSLGTDKSTGVEAGYDHAREVAETYSKGWVLIGVAGMGYAAAVESKGFEVISTSSETIKRALEERLAKQMR